VPYNTTGKIFYTTNTTNGELNHGQPVVSEGVAGVAVKQGIPAWNTPVDDLAVIADDEDFAIICKGIVQVAEVAGFAVGDEVYISGSNVLSETGTGNSKFGRVVEIEGERGTPSNHVRIDLDAKDSF
jgi:uncharacterized protein DUF2190